MNNFSPVVTGLQPAGGTPQTSYTPFELVSVFSNYLKPKEERQPIQLRGIYLEKQGKNHGGTYYDQLQDEISGHTLTIRVPERLRAILRDHRVYILQGLIERKVSSPGGDLGIQITFLVTNLISEEAPTIDPSVLERSEIISIKADKGFRHVEGVIKEKLRAKERPRVALVFGTSAIVDRDVLNALGPAQQFYLLSIERVSLMDKQAIITVLEQLDAGEYDLIGIVRGGGDKLEVFDDLEIARTVIELQTPFVTAIGHEVDRTFLDRLADRRFSTPTELGSVLGELAREAIREGSMLEALTEKEKALNDKESQYQEKIRTLTDQFTALQTENRQLLHKALIGSGNKGRRAMWALLWLAIGIILAYLLFRVIGGGADVRSGQQAQPTISPQPTSAGTPEMKNRQRGR